MLRITVELLPNGSAEGLRVIAVGEIARTGGGAAADYRASFEEDLLPDAMTGEVREYPRWSASIWDLVARSVCAALSGGEGLPPRPTVPNVPIHRSSASDISYVRLREIPEPARTFFADNIRHSTVPRILEDPLPMDCAFAWDWEDFEWKALKKTRARADAARLSSVRC